MMKTSIDKFQTKNTKIMVNFARQLILHCNHHAGSTEYVDLIHKGYVEVGELKQSGGFYWNSKFFNPADKYQNANEDDN